MKNYSHLLRIGKDPQETQTAFGSPNGSLYSFAHSRVYSVVTCSLVYPSRTRHLYIEEAGSYDLNGEQAWGETDQGVR